jgi:putative hydrolase of the HAD superfamily
VNTVLFDLDDTLLDYSGSVEESWTHAVQICCTDGRVEPAALIAALVDSRRWFWDDPGRQRRERTNMLRAWQLIVAHALDSLRAPCHDLVASVAEEFASHRRQVMQLFPDARATLDHLREQGIPLGLVTNGDASQQRYKIERHDLARYFDVIVIEGEFGAGKPDEIVFRHALDTLGAQPSHASMVGDHLDNDVAGARRVGIRAVWVDRAGAGLPADTPVHPDHIITSLTELTSLTART